MTEMLSSQKNLKDIYAVIVLYNCLLKDSPTFNSLNRSLNNFGATDKLSLLVYDNSPINRKDQNLDFSFWDICYYHDASNSGVSAAYNKGAELAEQTNKNWLFILDQDTIFPGHSIFRYLEAIDNKDFDSYQLFCPVLRIEHNTISPCTFKFFRGQSSKNKPPVGVFDLKEMMPINSGMMVRIAAFKKAGGYNSQIKLDFSDFEFIRRFSEHYSHAILLPIECQHGLSAHIVAELKPTLARFNFYIQGARILKRDIVSIINIEALLLLRALKFGYQYNSLSFLLALFQNQKT